MGREEPNLLKMNGLAPKPLFRTVWRIWRIWRVFDNQQEIALRWLVWGNW